jgi:oxygen-independent coproporphyrinogen-3 oxidase
VQTFDPALQAAIGRVQPRDQIISAVALLRAAGVGSINFDLMYGLPGQDDATLAATIEEAIALAPERLAVFGYAHVPHLIPRQRRIDARALPGRRRFGQAALAHDRLTRAGYRAIGFDHFAQGHDPLASAAANGRLRRNFQGFTDDPADIVIGLGASAISAFPTACSRTPRMRGHGIRRSARVGSQRRGLHRGPLEQRRARAIAGVPATASRTSMARPSGPPFANGSVGSSRSG